MNDNTIKVVSGEFYHSFIDHYDWHQGLGTSAGYIYFGLGDSDLDDMRYYGANEFGMRSYWKSTYVDYGNTQLWFSVIPIKGESYYFNYDYNNFKTNYHEDEYEGGGR
jgi:hypothetical protein